MALVDVLAGTLVLGAALDALRERFGSFELVEHWKQGEFHHDVVVRIPDGTVFVIATNCNGGVKDVSCFRTVPDRKALWAHRCPENPAFDADPAIPLARSTTVHWFDPCELLRPDARSELRREHRVMQVGGGWTERRPPICSKG
jgi:hypothetical protein